METFSTLMLVTLNCTFIQMTSINVLDNREYMVISSNFDNKPSNSLSVSVLKDELRKSRVVHASAISVHVPGTNFCFLLSGFQENTELKKELTAINKDQVGSLFLVSCVFVASKIMLIQHIKCPRLMISSVVVSALS